MKIDNAGVKGYGPKMPEPEDDPDPNVPPVNEIIYRDIEPFDERGRVEPERTR